MSPRQAYDILLRLYPRDYRVSFSAEMVTAFEAAAEERRERGRAVFIRFVLAELIGLVIGVGAEWTAKFTSASFTRGRCLPDLVVMRPPGVARKQWFGVQSSPFKALDLIDSTLPAEMTEAQSRVEFNLDRMAAAISSYEFERARFYSHEDRKARDDLRRLRKKYKV
jgi:hypothetical protein